MKKSILINIRFGTIVRLIAVILFLTIVMAIPGYAQDLFGYKLDVGIGSVKSVLENQGYTVHISRDLRFTRCSSIEILDFKNEYLDNMQLWINAYKDRVYIYKWDGLIMADSNTAASIKRLLHYISETFGEPEILHGTKSAYQNIDASVLKTIATDEESVGLDFLWKSNEKQIEIWLSPPLFPMSDMEVDFGLQYFLPKIQKELISYKKGEG
jgi:hypothetical protein